MKQDRARLYIIDGSAPGVVRLVKGSSHHAAISHVARSVLTYRVATAEEAFALGQSGVKIEVAGAEPPEAAQCNLDV